MVNSFLNNLSSGFDNTILRKDTCSHCKCLHLALKEHNLFHINVETQNWWGQPHPKSLSLHLQKRKLMISLYVGVYNVSIKINSTVQSRSNKSCDACISDESYMTYKSENFEKIRIYDHNVICGFKI